MPTLPAARVTDTHTCPVPGTPPHGGGPLLPPCSVNTLIGSKRAARLGDFALCAGPMDVVFKAASTVLINDLPAARLTDTTAHVGLITTPGEPTVLIGDPAFALPSNITVEGDPSFQNKTIRDLYLISTMPSGAALLSRLGTAGKPLSIVPYTGPNGFCTPESDSDARSGTATGSVVQYNPDFTTTTWDNAGNKINEPPQAILDHELNHALANALGTHRYGTDPTPPPSEPNMDREEAQAIGAGSHTGQNPSENSFRNDLGLPARRDHFWTGNPPAPGEPPALNLRPGG